MLSEWHIDLILLSVICVTAISAQTSAQNSDAEIHETNVQNSTPDPNQDIASSGLSRLQIIGIISGSVGGVVGVIGAVLGAVKLFIAIKRCRIDIERNKREKKEHEQRQEDRKKENKTKKKEDTETDAGTSSADVRTDNIELGNTIARAPNEQDPLMAEGSGTDYNDTNMASSSPTWDIKPDELKISDKALGDGKYSRVYQAKLTTNGEIIPVAAKVLLNRDVKPEELTTLHKLSIIIPHRNIIKFYGAMRSQTENKTTIVTELACNESLYDYLQKMKVEKKLLPTKRVLTWALDGIHAIKHLHDNDIMHRDIKSPNFLIMEDMTMKLCDFGISMPDGITTKTTGATNGTTRWKAPEVWDKKVSHKSDIFSFGAVMWEMIMCELPYHEHQTEAELVMAIYVNKLPLGPLPQSCPEELVKLITECRARERDERPNIEDIIRRLTILLQKHVKYGTEDDDPIQEVDAGARGTLEIDAATTLISDLNLADQPAAVSVNRRKWANLLRLPDVRERVRSEMVPSSVIHHLAGVINRQQEQQVKAKEREEGLISASDLLIDILLRCADDRWPEVFLAGLHNEGSVLAYYLNAKMQRFDQRGGIQEMGLPARGEPLPGTEDSSILYLKVQRGPSLASRPKYDDTDLLSAISDDLDYEFVGRKCTPDDASALYRHLNLDKALVQQMKHQNRDMSFVEVVVAVLQKWYQKNGRDATRKALLRALKDAGIRNVADKLAIEYTTRKSNR